MKNSINKIFLALLVGFASCEVEEIVDPNGPSVESFAQDATAADLQLLVSGLESVMRVDLEFYYVTVSSVGREYYDLNQIDPRYTAELLGGNGVALDPQGFLTTRHYAAKFRAIRNAYVLIEAATNGLVNDEERNGYLGFARTMLAYQLLLELTRQFENGVRLDTQDPDNLGPFSAGYQAGLNGIVSILDQANNELAAAGSSFNFNVSRGLIGQSNPSSFAQFNRALAARVHLYRNDDAASMAALNASFFDMAGNLFEGASHPFGSGAGDIMNPIFFVAGEEIDRFGVHPSFFTDAEAGDTRVTSKTSMFGTPITLDGLTADAQPFLYSSNNDEVPMIRNEELILIYAELNAGVDPGGAVAAIDVVRTAAGLPGYSGAMDEASLIDEILHQRRYSLFGEGHRWIDMRRFDRLGDLPLDRPGDRVHIQFPRPLTEG